ncbi:MAG: MoaD family protein [Chloroflexota bacterium]|nr:MoaD family protein [Chloroflexota bacterium]
MSVKIELHPFLYQYIENNQRVIEVDGETVGECLSRLVALFPQLKARLFDRKGTLFTYLNIYVNGENAYPDELGQPVKDGDQIHILPITIGG